MGLNIIQKILNSHIVDGVMEKGSEVGIKIDQTLTQDATGTMAYLQFEAMNLPRVKTELSVSYVDHNTLQDGFENADDHLYLKGVAGRYGIYYSKAGNGICHQVHLERFGKPGKTLLGSDSHTPTCGGIGMIAIGAGGLDVACAMAGLPFYLIYPKVIKIDLHGRLKPWVSAKDVILKILEILTTKGNVGYCIEYGGEGISTLSVPERATITNMGAELGVTTSIFPSDEVTLEFLKAQKREKDFVEIKPDPDATYDKVIEIDLDQIEPMVALPHSPDNVKKVKDLRGLKVNQVLIGSCTNSSYKDLKTVAEILKGRKVHPDVSFGVAPGSRQVLLMLLEDGGLNDIVSAGARILECTCGFCIGAGQAPSTGAVSLRTNNRNFMGRSGTMSAGVYLVSPEVAAVSALYGHIMDPRDSGLPYPDIRMPESFVIDDSMIIAPPPIERAKEIEIVRGPNIGSPPETSPIPDDIEGEVLLKLGDKITTDHIMPAGPRLKYRSNIEKYSTFVFEGIDPHFHERAKALKKEGKAAIVVGGLSYGQGSSREHAAMCPMHLGVRVIITKSFERIHSANLVNFGILPLTFADEKDYDRVDSGDLLRIIGVRDALSKGNTLFDVDNITKGIIFKARATLTKRQVKLILAGGLLKIAQ